MFNTNIFTLVNFTSFVCFIYHSLLPNIPLMSTFAYTGRRVRLVYSFSSSENAVQIFQCAPKNSAQT